MWEDGESKSSMRHAGIALLVLASLSLAAQQTPDFRGATITPVHAAGDLRKQIESLDSANERVWVGYTIPASHARHVRVCCSLDDDDVNITTLDDDEPAQEVAILYHLRNGAISTVRAFSSCAVSARGAHIYWLDGVRPRDSVNLLAAMAKSDTSAGHKALFALSLHEDATDALIDLAHHGDRRLRGTALFWLAQTAADKAAGVLRDAVDNDPDEEVRSKAVFGIAQLPNDQSIPLLAELMRTHRNRAVRKKAAFWLGQKNDPRALEAIEAFLRQ